MLARSSNRHPADALADVRAEIKMLETREEKLRQQLIAGDDRVGVDWQATVLSRTHERLDVDALLKHFGREALVPFFKSVSFAQVYLKRRKH